MADPFDFGPEERGFEPIFEGDTLYSGGETQDATGQEFEELFKVRGSGDTFYPQKIKESPSGQIVGQETIGRGRQSREEAEEAIETRVRNRTAANFGGFEIGDFNLPRESDIDMARAAHLGRSDRAINTDKSKRAAITTDASLYAKNPGQYDYPGVDTPTSDPQVLPKDYKYGGKPRTNEFENQKQESDFQNTDLVREIGGESVYSEEVVEQGPQGMIPGLAPMDFETQPEPAFDGGKEQLGPRPSATRLPEDDFQNLASGPQADMSFIEAEEQRRQANSLSDLSLFDGRVYEER